MDMNYKPYTLEWSRKRYLNEAIQKYFDDDCSAEVVLGDIIDILEENLFEYRKKLDKINIILENVPKYK